MKCQDCQRIDTPRLTPFSLLTIEFQSNTDTSGSGNIIKERIVSYSKWKEEEEEEEEEED